MSECLLNSGSGTGTNAIRGTVFMSRHLAAKSGIISTLTMYVSYNSYYNPFDATASIGIYSDSGGNPDARLSLTSHTMDQLDPTEWVSKNITPVSIVAGNYYWLAVRNGNGTNDGGCVCMVLSGGTSKSKVISSLPNPAGSGYADGDDVVSVKAYGTPIPVISDVDTDESVSMDQNEVIISGTDFEGVRGIGKVEICNNSVYASASIKVEQYVTSWSDTSIVIDVIAGSLSPGMVYLFVTTNSNQINITGIPITFVAEVSVISNIDGDNVISEGQSNVSLLGGSFGSSQGSGKLELCDSSSYSGATIFEEQTISSWSVNRIYFTVVTGELSTGSIYAFVTNNNGGRNIVGFTITLQSEVVAFPSISGIDSDNSVTVDQNDVVLSGFNFNAVQGTGVLEFTDDASYDSATVVEEQTVRSWSDESIVFDVVPGGLSVGTVYAFVTNSNNRRNATGFTINLFAGLEVTSPIDSTKIKVRWGEPYVSEAVNRHSATVPAGLYMGGLVDIPVSPALKRVRVGNGNDNYSMFVLHDNVNGFGIVVYDNENITIDCTSFFPVTYEKYLYIGIRTDYATGDETTGEYFVTDIAPDYNQQVGNDGLVFARVHLALGATDILLTDIERWPGHCVPVPFPDRENIGLVESGDRRFGLLSNVASYCIPTKDQKDALSVGAANTDNPYLVNSDLNRIVSSNGNIPKELWGSFFKLYPRDSLSVNDGVPGGSVAVLTQTVQLVQDGIANVLLQGRHGILLANDGGIGTAGNAMIHLYPDTSGSGTTIIAGSLWNNAKDHGSTYNIYINHTSGYLEIQNKTTTTKTFKFSLFRML